VARVGDRCAGRGQDGRRASGGWSLADRALIQCSLYNEVQSLCLARYCTATHPHHPAAILSLLPLQISSAEYLSPTGVLPFHVRLHAENRHVVINIERVVTNYINKTCFLTAVSKSFVFRDVMPCGT
jgi:hypothetical protein